MKKITLILALVASMITISSAEMFGGMIGDMMDIPKEIVTSGTDVMKEMKDVAKDTADEVKDSATDIKNDATDKATNADANSTVSKAEVKK